TVQEVVTTKIEPVQTIDPCTGCAVTVYKQVPEIKKVKLTVYEAVPVEKQVVDRYPYLKPVEKDVIVKQLVVDETTEAAIEKRLRAITVREVTPLPVHPAAPCCGK